MTPPDNKALAERLSKAVSAMTLAAHVLDEAHPAHKSPAAQALDSARVAVEEAAAALRADLSTPSAQVDKARGEVGKPSPNWCRTCDRRKNDPMAAFCSDPFHLPTPQPQGDVTPQARPEGYDDGSGRIRDWREQARPDGGEMVLNPTAFFWLGSVLTTYGDKLSPSAMAIITDRITHPTPAPDVARLVEVAKEVADEHMGLAATTIYHGDDDEVGMRACCDVRSYDPHTPDCPALKLREALAPFTVAQQESDQ